MKAVVKQLTDVSKLIMLVCTLSLLGTFAVATSQGSPPEITFNIDFPSQISADGEKVQSFVFFRDPDKDIVQISFELTKPHEAEPVSFDPQVKGKLSGVIKFTIAATSPPLELEICVGEAESCKKIRAADAAPAEVTFAVTLIDEAGNESEPKEFGFKVVAVEARPVLQVSPVSLEFQGQVGGANPPSQALQITNAGGGTLTWNAQADAAWLSLSPTSGTAPSTVTVLVRLAGLQAGSYQGKITISAPGAQNSPATVSVILTVGEQRVPPPSGTPYADQVVSFRQGTEANREWGDPEDALGPPDLRLNPQIVGLVNLGIGGSITLKFMDNEIVDRPGDDLRIWGDPDNDELIRVEVSADGVTFRDLGTVGEMANLDLAAAGLSSAKFVRITDDGSREQSGGPAPGAEIDAVAALPAPGTPYADRVVSFQQGSYGNPDFSEPAFAAGAPDLTTDPLGGFVNLGVGGSIILDFWDNVVVDGPGDDLRIWGDPYNDEQIQVEVSADGSDYRSFGLVGEMANLDLAQVGLSSARFVRITDDGSREQVGTESMPGAELDAVEALHSEQR